MNAQSNKVDLAFVGGMTAIFLATAWFLVMWLLWQLDLPRLGGLGGPIPDESISDHILAWLKLFLNNVSTTPSGPGWWAADAAVWRAHCYELRGQQLIPWGRDFVAIEVAAIFSILFFDRLYRSQKNQDKKIHVEGKRLVNTAAARRAGRDEEKRSQKVIDLAPGVSCTLDRIRRSVLILGSIGGGKTQTIWYLLSQLIAARFKLLVIDGPKGDFSVSMPGKPLIISPWHSGPAWDIARDCPTRGHARELARRLIPSNDKDPLWSNAAQAIFVAAVCKLISTKPGQWGWGDLYDQVNVSPDQLKETAATYYPPAVQLISDAESRTTQSILINLAAFTSDVYELALAWRHTTEKFSFLEWWSRDDHPQQVVILQGSAEFESLAAGYISAIVSLLAGLTASSTFPQSKTRKNLIVADEFAQLPRMDSFPKFLEIGRSKGCSALIATQSPAQLVRKWGKDTLQSWLAMVGTKIFCRTLGADDQGFVMREIGERKILRKRESISAPQGGGKTTITTAWEEVPDSVVSAELLEKDLGPVQDGVRVLISGLGDPFVETLPYFQEKRYRDEFIPNPNFNSTKPTPPSSPNIGDSDSPEPAPKGPSPFHLDPDAAEVGDRLTQLLNEDGSDAENFASEPPEPEQEAASFSHHETETNAEAPRQDVFAERFSWQDLPDEKKAQTTQPKTAEKNFGVACNGIDEFLFRHLAVSADAEDKRQPNGDEQAASDLGVSLPTSADDALKAALHLLSSDVDKSKGPKPK